MHTPQKCTPAHTRHLEGGQRPSHGEGGHELGQGGLHLRQLGNRQLGTDAGGHSLQQAQQRLGGRPVMRGGVAGRSRAWAGTQELQRGFAHPGLQVGEEQAEGGEREPGTVGPLSPHQLRLAVVGGAGWEERGRV